jgi:hypothetical protein
MAISVQLAQFVGLGRAPGQRGQLVEMPPVRVDRVAAAATVLLAKGSTLYTITNFADPCAVRINALDDPTAASSADVKSIVLGTGQQLDFMLPDRSLAVDWKLMVGPLA